MKRWQFLVLILNWRYLPSFWSCPRWRSPPLLSTTGPRRWRHVRASVDARLKARFALAPQCLPSVPVIHALVRGETSDAPAPPAGSLPAFEVVHSDLLIPSALQITRKSFSLSLLREGRACAGLRVRGASGRAAPACAGPAKSLDSRAAAQLRIYTRTASTRWHWIKIANGLEPARGLCHRAARWRRSSRPRLRSQSH